MNAGEFSWKLARPGKGAVCALLHAMKYLVVPLMLVFTLSYALEQADGPRVIQDLLGEMQFLVLVFGIVIAALGFFKGAYPKGSYSRLTFGMAVAVLAIIYALSLLLGGRLEEAVSRELFELDLDALFVLYFIPAVFTIFMQLGEFSDHRRPWMEEMGMVPPGEREDPAQHRWFHDFRLRYGSLYHGFKLSRAALVGYVVLPLMVLILIQAGFSELDVDEVDDMVSTLEDIARVLVLFGVAIAALSFPKGFYPKGSVSRLLPAVAVVLLSIWWIWTLGMEGRFVLDSIEQVQFYLDYTGILLLVVFGTSLWIVYYILEFLLHRREWKEGGFQRELDRKKVKAAKASPVREEEGAAANGTPPAESEEAVKVEAAVPEGDGTAEAAEQSAPVDPEITGDQENRSA